MVRNRIVDQLTEEKLQLKVNVTTTAAVKRSLNIGLTTQAKVTKSPVTQT